MDGATGATNLFGEPTDFANGQKFGNARSGIVMTRDVGQNSFESAGLQRQADMADTQRSHRRGSGSDRREERQFEFGGGHVWQLPLYCSAGWA